MHAPQPVGPKQTGECWRFISSWAASGARPASSQVLCAGLTSTAEGLASPMETFFAFLIPGLFTGAAYAIAASGLVLTYTTTRVFNIAHGAFGMVLSFVFWDFTIRQGLPVWLSLVLVLLVVAPLIGLFVQRVITRGLGNAPVSVSLVVTVGLFVGLIGVAQQRLARGPIEPDAPRFVPPFLQTFADGDGIPAGRSAAPRHRPPADHHHLLDRRRRRALPPAQQDPHRHGDARPRSTTPTCSRCSAASPTTPRRWPG